MYGKELGEKWPTDQLPGRREDTNEGEGRIEKKNCSTKRVILGIFGGCFGKGRRPSCVILGVDFGHMFLNGASKIESKDSGIVLWYLVLF